MISTLYLSYDGMTDPLGQSQVLPYLKKIAINKEIHIISCEKPLNFRKHRTKIDNIIEGSNIHWHPLQYHKFPPILSTLWDLWRIKKLAVKLNKDLEFKLIHCRSHLMAILGAALQISINIPYIFDMRSFFPEERVDGNLWPQNNPIYRLIYKYFKIKEIEMFNSATHIVVLTETAKEILKSKYHQEKISVIPCCADFDLFNYKNVSQEEIKIAREDLMIDEHQFILSYLGSIGTWYELDHMLELFSQIKLVRPNSVFVFFTPSDPDTILSKLVEYDISQLDVRIRFIDRIELPRYLLTSSVSVFFIKNTYSKKASSPTKHAELMGLGIPIIANYGIGDLDSIIEMTRTGKLINIDNSESIYKGIQVLDELVLIDKAEIRNKGKEIYSLKKGSEIYDQIYSNVINK